MNVPSFGLLKGKAKAGEDEFVRVVVGVCRGCADVAVNQKLVEVINRAAAEFCGLVESDTALLIEHDGDFLQQFTFAHLGGLQEFGGKGDVHGQSEKGMI